MAFEDGKWVARTLAGDRCAFATLVERYRNMLCGLAYHYLRNADDAQDAAQQAFIHAYLHLSELRDHSRFGPWLRRIAMSQCAMRLRQRGYGLIFAEPAESQNTDMASRVTTQLAVEQALDRLSPKVRLTVTLHYLSGYSLAEIARFLDIPLNTVRSRLQHARHQLREEMTAMTNETFPAFAGGKTDPQFTQETVEKAIRQGEAALDAYDKPEAVRQFDTALAALARWEPGETRERLKMKALWQKGKAVGPYRSGYAQAIPLFEQALALAEELGDRKSQADKLLALGNTYYNTNQPEYAPKIVDVYQKAREIYKELGDLPGEGYCWRCLGDVHLHEDVAQGHRDYERALVCFEATEFAGDIAYCRALLDAIAEIGEARFGSIIGRYTGQNGLKLCDGALSNAAESCSISYTWEETPEEAPLKIQRVFWQIGRLSPFLKPHAAVNEMWTGPAESYSEQPLQLSATVISHTESVTVPAGTYSDCLLMEYVTRESDLPDNASEDKKQGNREEHCGVRRAWFAPGVGLVQLHVEQTNGNRATIQLQEVAIQTRSTDYLPLAVGNRWVYGWADVPSVYVAKEVYHVTALTKDAQGEDVWILEHYAYAYK